MTIDFDSEIRVKSFEFADKALSDIIKSLNSPDRAISGDVLRLYQKYESWGFFETYPLSDKKYNNLYRNLLAMYKYDSLKLQKENPKRSKWEIVTGKAPKK